jgi:hypothetical protein
MSEAFLLKLQGIADKVRGIARRYEVLCRRGDPSCSERNFMNEVEGVLEREVWSRLGVPKPEYEYKVHVDEGFVGRHYGRIDAYYGLVLFEYKRPYPGLDNPSVRDGAIRQVRDYINGLLNDENTKAIISRIRREGFKPLITGVVLDGNHVVFIEYDVDSGILRLDPEVGVHELNGDALRRIIRSVLASWRKRLDAKLLAADFGYGSDVARNAVNALYKALMSALNGGGGERVRVLFEEWVKLASMVYPINTTDLAQLAEDYGITGDKIDGAALFFAIETYYALVLKLIAAEVASRFYDTVMSSFMESLRREVDSRDGLQRRLRDFEEGGPTAWYGVSNLLEGQLFSWYLDAWSDEVYDAVKGVIEKLSEYDVESLTLNPQWARDVFKLLYEELVPRREVRQRMGIYTTPDWLAELILDNLGLTVDNMVKMRGEGKDPLDIRILDPGVGTGTFLTLYIQRIGEYLRRVYNGNTPPDAAREALRKVVRNVVGFDIEVLALMTARANYLIALASAGLLQYKSGTIEIPVYMANSVVPAELMRDKALTKGGEVIEVVKIPTSICDCGEKTKCCFMLPARLVMSGLANDVLNEVLNGLRKNLDYTSLRQTLEKFKLSSAEDEVLREFYEKLLELKKRGVDDVWIPVIKSYVLPILYRKSFDYVVGNPPWLSLRYIADPSYQDVVKRIIRDVYGLTEEEHLVTQMEMAALFLARAVNYYAKDGGLVGFVMPKSIYSADQHHNLRVGATKVNIALRRIIDCEDVQPLFYVPAIAVIAERGSANWPIEATVISGRLPEDRHKVMPLGEAARQLRIEERRLFLNRVGGRSFLDYREIRIVARRSEYYDGFFQGATVVPSGLWFVRIIDASSPDFVVVETNRARVEERGHVSVNIGPLPVEREFIYGLLTSAEVVPFCHLQPNPAVLPITPSNSGYRIIQRPEAQARGKAHLTRYLEEVEEGWRKSKSSQGMTIYERLDYDGGLSKQSPNLRYKVVYLRSGTNLAATVVVDEPYPVKVGSSEVKVNGIIIHTTLYLYQTNNENEAHYLTAVLNSSILNELVKPMQTKGAYGPRDFHKKPLEFPIPQYDPNNPIHRRLSELGREAKEVVCRGLNRVLQELGYLGIVNNYYNYMYGYSSGAEQSRPLMPNQVGRLRDYIRDNVIRDILAEVDQLVVQLLSASSRGGSILDFLT